ncbi:hypothetical protein LC612_39960 [Nostoc sp. CHAB 5834]|nr:hypothetical protein [Nostoc sp. CHAB 5834]
MGIFLFGLLCNKVFFSILSNIVNNNPWVVIYRLNGIQIFIFVESSTSLHFGLLDPKPCVASLSVKVVALAEAEGPQGWLTFEEWDKEASRLVRLRVPRQAFICAALRRAGAVHLAPNYQAVCPTGLKFRGNDAWHTDAWLGAGFALSDAYDESLPEQRLFMRKLYELQREYLQFDFDVLARGSRAEYAGAVVHDPAAADIENILVLDSAAPEYAPAAMSSLAVIVETGSKLAHMTVVSRESRVPVIRVENARKLFLEGGTVTLNFDTGKLDYLSLTR